MKVALAFSTKDRVELTEQTFPRIGGEVDIFWCDGSTTDEGKRRVALGYAGIPLSIRRYEDVRGGADAAIVFALSQMLASPTNYTHFGLLENDVLLPVDWHPRTMALFHHGESDGLEVGAVSARCYEDRILLQRDEYAVCHNLGAGHVIFTRKAAELLLAYYRTGWWADNRKVFSTLSGIDIGHYACFRGAETHTTCDWHFDAVLAQHGLASLACTPSGVEMIGQDPPLEDQGLKLVREPVEERRNDSAFETFRHHTRCVREWKMRLDVIRPHLRLPGAHVYFAHQIPRIGGVFKGDWGLKWSQGFGGFSYVSNGAALEVPVFGPLNVLVSGGEKGARVLVRDRKSGYEVAPEVLPEGEGQMLSLQVPGNFAYREIFVECEPGARLFAVQTGEVQPWFPEIRFNHAALPPVRD